MRQRWLALILFLLAMAVTIVFILHSYKNFKIEEGLTPLPLSFDPYTSTSTYHWNGTSVSIQGGFVKGKVIENNKEESLLLRALSPTPTITLKGSSNTTIHLRLENISLSKIKLGNDMTTVKILDPHTVLMSVAVKQNQENNIKVELRSDDNPEVIILGDNRNGYGTFSQIIDQVNGINSSFVIDNGDLVYGGEPNKYRLFYETVSKLQVPIFTTLGNHDIRENGRGIYTMLFGPPYYSFDYFDNHFIFLDSSRGWSEKTAIPEEQYQWLENDLKLAQGKRIFVVSHIPSTDPRAQVTPNTYAGLAPNQKTGLIQKEMNKLSGISDIDHAFIDKEEAKKFEGLMTKYKVDTVYLSHIHSFYSFVKNNVRYVITGGAGAELLTQNSFYHYIRAHITNKENYLEIVELPSPPNQIIDRYWAAGVMFARSIYKEYQTLVLAILAYLVLILSWILWIYRQTWWSFLKRLGYWLYTVMKFSFVKYKEIVRRK